MAVGGRTNQLFFRARSWVDTDGSGLPDWWQLQYFGTTGIDPYGDPDNDGWSNLQEYQNGTNPNGFNTPPPPKNITVTLDTSGTNVTLTWESGGGAVTGYAINRSYSTPLSFSAATHTHTTSVNKSAIGALYGPQYQIVAQYSNSVVSASPWLTVNTPRLGVSAQTVRGPAAGLYLTMPAPPENFSKVRIFGWEYDFINGGYNHPYFELSASNWVTGISQLPLNQFVALPPTGFLERYGQAIAGTNIGQYFDATPRYAPELYNPYPIRAATNFVNAAAHLKQNLKFLLRAATVHHAFTYDSSIMVGTLADYGGPTDWYMRDGSPADYEYAGYHFYDSELNCSIMQERRPIHDNYLWRNFGFNLGSLAPTGAGYAFGYGLKTLKADLDNLPDTTYAYFGNGTETPLPSVLTNYTWVYFHTLFNQNPTNPPPADNPDSIGDIGLEMTTGNLMYFPTGVKNLYGLPITSILYKKGSVTNVLNPGNTSSGSLDEYLAYYQTAEPVLQTVAYQFFSQTPWFNYGTPCSVPGAPGFAVTNSGPLLISGVGQLFTVMGYAKQAITNGYAGKYAYLEQYFDQAYRLGTNGVATTNSAGLLSPYGEFFPTEPGPAALVTLPDIETGARGTGVVQVIKLQLDVNHDGVMDTSFAGPDNTSPERPFSFWLNNNYDRSKLDDDDSAYYEDDVKVADCPYYLGVNIPDSNYRNASGYRVIPTKRDLEDYARLWVSGITTNWLVNLPAGSTVTLSWGDVSSPNSANPTIDLFAAADADGGIGYLTNSTIAAQQTNATQCPFIGRLTPGGSVQLNAGQWAGNYFIWCGVVSGSGALTLSIKDGSGNTLAETTANIQLQDIKQMYERYTLGDNLAIAPAATARLAVEGLPPGAVAFQHPTVADTNTPYILFVHGWNMEVWEKDRFAETAFKRLYWQGYQGRFGSLRWPTGNRFTGWKTAITDPDNFDHSEFTAWNSGLGLFNKLTDLNGKYPGEVYLMAHSMGNVVAGEAVRLAATNQVVNTYVAMQGAVAAHSYDPFTPTRTITTPLDSSTPNRYAYYPTNGGQCYFSTSAGAGTYVNFYNTNDFALDKWRLNQDLKPDLSYSYNGTNFLAGSSILYFPQFTYQLFAYCVEARCFALGAQKDVGGSFQKAGNPQQANLPSVWPPDPQNLNYKAHLWHSAEFRTDTIQSWQFWRRMLTAFDLQ